MNRLLVSLGLLIALASGWWLFAGTNRSAREAPTQGGAPAVDGGGTPGDPGELQAPHARVEDQRVSSPLAPRATDVPTSSSSTPAGDTSAQGRAQALVTVREAETKEPLADFTLTIESQYVSQEARTDSDGRVLVPLEFVRGRLDFGHALDPDHERFHEPWEFVEDSVLVDMAEGAQLEVGLQALPPAARVVADLVRASGASALGAEAQLAQGTFLDGVVRWHHWRIAKTDTRGRVVFYLHHAADLEDSFTLSLREPLEGEVSDLVFLGPPLDTGPHRLVLYPGSEVEVLVTDEAQVPLPGLHVRAVAHQPTRRLPSESTTDDEGRLRIAPLPAGNYTLNVRFPGGRQLLVDHDLALARGSVETVHLTVDSERLELQTHVTGRVLDHSGSPVEGCMLAVSLDGGPPVRVFSGEDGAFLFESTLRADDVTVLAAASVFGPDITPASLTVPSGTRDLEFRQGEDPGEVLVVIHVVDAATGAPLPDEDDVAIRVYRQAPAGQRIVATAAFGPDEGSTEVDFGRHEDMHWLVTAPGYRERRGGFSLPAPGEDPPILRVELERGFRRELVVHDQLTGNVLAGVAVLDDEGRRLATTGFDGRVVIESAEWPEWLTLALDGYEPLRWRSRSHWFWYSDRFWLAPALAADTAGDEGE